MGSEVRGKGLVSNKFSGSRNDTSPLFDTYIERTRERTGFYFSRVNAAHYCDFSYSRSCR